MLIVESLKMPSGAGDVLAERERESGLCDFNTITSLGTNCGKQAGAN